MSNRTLAQVCQRIVRECLALNRDERCLLIKDLEPFELASNLETAINTSGGIAQVLEIPTEVYMHEPLPKSVEPAMTSADVVLLCTKELFPHKARRLAAEAGARVLSLGTVTKEMALRALDVDYDELARVTKSVADAYARAEEVRMTTRTGTDVRMMITSQPVHSFDGLARERGKTSALPAGVVATLPLPGTAEGIVVLDGSIASIGLLKNPITLTVKAGRVTDIQGGEEAEKLLRTLNAADANARCVIEVGMGTNPRAAYVGNLVEDERVRGSGHIGLGRNVQLGGTIESKVHLDATLREPSIYLDGKVIVNEGKLLIGGK